MDLPTYTNIWRIEKRLYKLYDLRLPMPLPLGQIVAFVGITVPYVLLLTLIGIPFSHNLFWLYVLPPGVLTWLVTRPVLENKKLPELLVSQVRYLGEPKVWCRMASATEKDEIVVVGQVWHASRQPATAAAAVEIRPQASVPAYAAGLPAWAAPASAPQGPPAGMRHRNPAAWGPRPATPGGGRVPVPDRRAAAGFAPQPARTGAGPAPGERMAAHGSPARPRAGAGAAAQAQRHPVRPPASATRRGQQPAWATRARPGGPLGRPAGTARRPRVIEVAHAEQSWPTSHPAGPPLTPVPGGAPPHRAASAHAAPPPPPGHIPPPPWDPRARTGQRVAPYVPGPDRAPRPDALRPGAARPAAKPASPPSQPSGTGTWPSVPAGAVPPATGPAASVPAAPGPAARCLRLGACGVGACGPGFAASGPADAVPPARGLRLRGLRRRGLRRRGLRRRVRRLGYRHRRRSSRRRPGLPLRPALPCRPAILAPRQAKGPQTGWRPASRHRW